MNDLKNKQTNILVIGDFILDRYLWGKCERISPEAPVQIVDIKDETFSLGGAGNVVNNLVSLNASVSILGILGDDLYGDILIKKLKKANVATDNIIQEKDRKTVVKSRIIAANQQVIRFDEEKNTNISKDSEIKLLASLQSIIHLCDIVLMSDYNKGTLNTSFTQSIIGIAKSHNKRIIIDPKGKNYEKYRGATLITPNKKEAVLASNIDIVDDDSLASVGFKLKNDYDLCASIITLSENGMAIFDEKMEKIPTVAKEVYDVTGAGDTVLASLGYALSCGYSLKSAAVFATSAAAVVVGKLGSATANIEEIETYEKALHVNNSISKIKTISQIKEILEKSKNQKIVFTNGCFDILHIGHIKYLESAKNMGDTLIVGLNSDESVKRLKGNNRPINLSKDRAYMLSALEFVDYVIEFKEDTPHELIKVVKPDILVKGGDYKNKQVVGSDIAKEVRLVDFIDGKSTTKIIKMFGLE